MRLAHPRPLKAGILTGIADADSPCFELTRIGEALRASPITLHYIPHVKFFPSLILRKCGSLYTSGFSQDIVHSFLGKKIFLRILHISLHRLQWQERRYGYPIFQTSQASPNPSKWGPSTQLGSTERPYGSPRIPYILSPQTFPFPEYL